MMMTTTTSRIRRVLPSPPSLVVAASWILLLLLLVPTMNRCSIVEAVQASSNSIVEDGRQSPTQKQHLRSSSSASAASASSSSHQRQHIVRRLYGEENALVRKEISQIEERIAKYQTGYNADPNHVVPYNDHPYDPAVRRRRALQQNTTIRSTSDGDDDTFQPMRIVFETKALDDVRDSSNAAKIDWYKNEILPKTAKFWSQTLSVVPVSGRLRITSGELDNYLYCGDPEFTQVPNEHKSTGVNNADLILYVSGSASSRFCPARTLAVAVPCNFDQYDRPTAGAINVCLDNIELNSDGTAEPDIVNDYIDVSIHEVAHVLGHSSNSYRYFWDPDTGTPRTSRPFSERTVTCVNGETRSLVLPDANTMEFGADASGRRYAAIVTPKVRTVAQNQFNCPSLSGAQLENQPTRSESCTGDHWDERLFYPEALSGVIAPTANILSSLTLALMEDSGWYKANYTNSRMSPWGLGAGCDFVNAPCLTNNQVGETIVPDYAKGFFCNKGATKGCSSEHSHKLACTVLDYHFFVPQDLPDENYQYFPDEPTKGGPRQADFCPVYGTTYDNLEAEQLDCKNPDNAPTPLNVYGEVFGAESQCVTSTAGEGLCYKTACVKEDMSLRINVLGKYIKCESDFEAHTISVGQGLVRTTIFCPRLSQACPDLFCPFNCAGRGVCNYNHAVNGTVQPKCECFDPNDTSEACSDSLIPSGQFLEDDGGLFDNLEENFFDPLIKVFVDHPDAWTAASYAWAAGLTSIFLILLLCICSSVIPQRPKKK